MQRSALGLVAAVYLIAVLTGCTSPTKTSPVGRLPEPLWATRPPAKPLDAVPRPPEPQPKPAAPRFDTTVPRSWTPSGGIRRGLWKEIVVHHSASPRSTPQGMNSWHLQRGWENGLGYHFVIGNGVNYPDGEVYVGQRWRSQIQGAHCKTGSGRYLGRWLPGGYFNDHGIGICLIGDFQNSPPTRAQLASLQRLLAFLCRATGIDPENIHGHGEVTHKTACPGRYVDMSALRRSAAAILAGEGPFSPYAFSR